MFKKKILSIAVIAILLFVCLANSGVLASGNLVSIDASNTTIPSSTTGASGGITITRNTTGNTSGNLVDLNSTTTPANNTVTAPGNTNTNTNAVNMTPANNSSYNNASSNRNNSGLPYTGTNSSMIFVVIAFAISALYAYKKVRDYNI